MLRSAEKSILNFLKTPYKGFYIDIGSSVGDSDKIWTIALNEGGSKIPLLLLHGDYFLLTTAWIFHIHISIII